MRYTVWLILFLGLNGAAFAEKAGEPLPDYATRFAECDARIRAIDPSDPGCTNYVQWVREAIDCKNKLELPGDIVPWLEKLAASQPNSWKMAHAVAMGYCHASAELEGAFRRERVKSALALMDRASRLAVQGPCPDEELGALCEDYLSMLIEPPSYNYTFNDDAVFCDSPLSYEASTNDCERIRWLIHQKELVGYHPEGFEWNMATYAAIMAGSHTTLPTGETSEYYSILSALRDDETVMWEHNDTGTWHRIIKLPKDYQFIPQFEQMAATGDVDAARTLGNIFINRCQLERAAHYFEMAGDTDRVDSIRANQGSFGRHDPKPEGAPLDVDYIFRNGSNVTFKIYRIDHGTNLLARLISGQVMDSELDLLMGKTKRHDSEHPLSRLKATDELVEFWRMPLSPLPDHQDAVQKIILPSLSAGNYWLYAEMEGGNKAETLLHIYDTVLFRFRREKDEKSYILCDAFTGEPRSNALLHFMDLSGGYNYNCEDRVSIDHPRIVDAYRRARTDEDGLYSTTTAYDYALAILDQDMPFVVRGGNYEFSIGEVWRRYNRDSDARYIFATTDRLVYRPGDTGHVKLWARDEPYSFPEISLIGNRQYELPLQTNLVAVAEDGRLRADRFGGADESFFIPEDAPLGTYDIKMFGTELLVDRAFAVEEYRAPEFDITAALSSNGTIEVQANYTYGQPIASGEVKLELRFYERTQPNWFPGRTFDFLWGRGYWWNGDQFGPKKEKADPWDSLIYQDVSGKLDAEGKLRIDLASIKNGTKASQTPGYFKIEATVANAAHKAVSKDIEIPVSFPERSLCCWLDNAFYGVDEPVVCHVAYEHQEFPLSLEVRNLSDTNAPPIQRIPVEQENAYALDPLPAGAYGIKLVSSGGTESPTFEFSICDDQVTDLTKDNPLRLVVEKGQYKVGDKARILIQVDQPGRYVYWFERVLGDDMMIHPRLIRMDSVSKVVSFPLKADYDEGFIQSAAMTIVDGQPFIADCKIPVIDPVLDAGTVELKPEQPVYRPGETVKIDILTLDALGNGRPASVTITVYNKALDLIAGEMDPCLILEKLFAHWTDAFAQKVNLYEYFETIVPVPAMNSLMPEGLRPIGLLYSMGKFVFRDIDSFSVFGSSASVGEASRNIDHEKELQQKKETQIRKDFRDLAYWNATVETDAEGRVSVEFPMPDSLTEWKIMAWGMHANYAASGTATITCAKALVLQLNLPRFMVAGDEVEISGSLRNHSTNGLDAAVSCSVSGSSVRVESSAVITVENMPADSAQLLYWNMVADAEGEATVTLSAQSERDSDGMAKPLPVLPHGMLKRGGNGGVLAGNRMEEKIAIAIPDVVDPGSLSLELNCSPDMMQSLVSALPFLSGYPHGCTEQTLNRFLPSLVVLQTLETLGIEMPVDAQAMPPERQAVYDPDEIRKRAQAGIERLEDAQRYDGWFGWNLDSDSPADRLISAWIIRGLHIAAQTRGLEISQYEIANGLNGIASRMKEGLRLSSNEQINNTDALLALVFTEIGVETYTNEWLSLSEETNTVTRFVARLSEKANDLSLYGKTLLAYTYALRGEDGKCAELVRFIEQYLENDPARGTYWLRTRNEGWWCWYNDDVELHAWYLKLLNRLEPNSAKTAGVARYLMQNRMYGDHWKSTRDTAICIEALCEFMVNNRREVGDAAYEVLLNGETVPHSKSGNYRLEQVKPGHNELVLKKPDGLPLFFDATWAYYTREDPITPEACELVSVARTYYRLEHVDGKEVKIPLRPDDLLNAGETIEVELALEASQTLEYLLAEDFKPAGFECIDGTSGWKYDGIGSYREYHDERVSCYIDHLPKGASFLRYRIRAEHAGKMSALPATVELMYAPRQAANSREDKLRVDR